MERITDLDYHQLIREQVRNPPNGESRLHAFVRLLWHTVETRAFVDNWHIGAICEVLTDVHEGRIKDVVINVPPGSCKTLLTSVFWPCFIWLEYDKSASHAFASYDQAVANKSATNSIELLTHPIIRGAWPEFSLGGEKEKKAVQNFYNAHKGLRFTTSVGSKFTGFHFDGHVYDDLLKPAAILPGVPAHEQKALNKARNWVDQTASNRAHDVAKLWRVMIMQRLHRKDPAGYALDQGWEHLCFPERYVKNAPFIFGDLTKRYDPRKKEGELLWPARRNATTVLISERNLRTEEAIQAQNQQNPGSDTAGILSRRELHYYKAPPRLLDCEILLSCDVAFKGKVDANSRCAFQLWARHRRTKVIYLLAAQAAWFFYTDAKKRIEDFKTLEPWSFATDRIIEDKANGSAIVDELKLTPFSPSSGDKTERMIPHLVAVKSGEILFPDPDIYPDTVEALNEICGYPGAAYNDHWDAMSQALSRLRFGVTSYAEALKAWEALISNA